MRQGRTGPTARRWLVAVVVSVVLAGTVAVPAPRTAGAEDVRWDRKVRPIAAKVERLRRLKFRHPVPVVFTEARTYAVRIAKARRAEWNAVPAKELRHEEFLQRALGIMVLDETLPDLRQDDSTSGLAEYDPRRGQILVRGRELDVATEVALARELTRALQDQHFGSHRLDRWLEDPDASATYRALVDGDAARIATAYLDTLGIREQRTYRDAVDEDPLPKHLSFPVFAVRGVPDLFGAPMVHVIQMDGGRRAIDRAFRHPPRRQVEMFDPTAVGSHAKRVRPPKLGNAEEPVGRARPLGALTLYTALALRIENEAAMRAADEVVASSARVYLDGSLICVRARFGTRGPASSRLVADTLRDWLGEGPPDNGTVIEQADGIVRFDSCEGENTAFEPFGIGDLVATPLVRNGFVLGQLAAGASPEVAKCVGDELMVDEEFNAAIEALLDLDEGDTSPAARDAAQRVARRRAEILRQCDAQ